MTDETTDTSQELGIIEKAFLMGIGAASLAKDKAQELADELIKRGSLTREQSDSFVARVVAKAEEASRSAQDAVTRESGKAIGSMGVASAKDLEEIRAELTEIKAMIASLRPAGAGADTPAGGSAAGS